MSTPKKVPQSKWEWLGHACHFIGGQSCQFHLATKVGGWLISTVGDLRWPHKYVNDAVEWPRDTLGIGEEDWFETMVFPAGERIDCGCYTAADWREKECKRYATSEKATAGHLAMCNKYAAEGDPAHD